MHPNDTDTEDFVTIIVQGYAIAGRVGPHRFSVVDGAGSSELFPGQEMIAATFSRRVGG